MINYYYLMTDPKIKFGDAIRKRRIEIGKSQELLSQETGLHRTYISEVERGKRNISLVNMIILFSALEITPSTFFDKYYQGE